MTTNTQDLKIPRSLIKLANGLTLPLFSEIDLDFVKQYLYVDFDEDDMLIQLLIESAKETLMFETGFVDEFKLDNSTVASMLTLQIVSDLYNTRSTLATDTKAYRNPLFTQMIKSIRGSYKGYKL